MVDVGDVENVQTNDLDCNSRNLTTSINLKLIRAAEVTILIGELGPNVWRCLDGHHWVWMNRMESFVFVAIRK